MITWEDIPFSDFVSDLELLKLKNDLVNYNTREDIH